MNELPQSSGKTQTTNLEIEVSSYLVEHPDFFCRHEHLLAHLKLPHPDTGQAISLIERQVGLLREQKLELKHKLQHLTQVARTNEQLLEKLQRLILSLIDSTNLEGAMEMLETAMRQDFHADAVTVWLFAEGECPPFMARNAPAMDAFRQVLEQAQPVCGYLSPEQNQALFGNCEHGIASGAIIPLSEGGEGLGLVGIGSTDPKRFHPEMGTVFLRHLGAVAARVLKSHMGL